MTSRYVALIPAYDPSSILCDLVRNLCNAGFSIVVVDDGSKDNCSNIFDDCTSRAAVLHHPKNIGKGQALKTGLSYIQSNFASDSVIVTVDADGQHTVEDALAICALAQRHSRSLVIGCRQFDKDVTLRNRFRNRLTAFMLHRSCGIRIRDPLSGLRAFSHSLIPVLLSTDGRRYEYEINVLLRLARDKIRILSHPVKTSCYENYSLSHFKMVKEALRASDMQEKAK